jgi:3-dehydro-L-gulonate 2-dehydrogenase
MLRIRYEELHQTLAGVLRRLGFEEERALLCARLFAETTQDGVYTHGLSRFPRFVRMIRAGRIDIHAIPEMVGSHGGLERWDGKCGPGNLNAYRSMDRAIALARRHGVGAVALANTNHWMRAGTYGWQAAEAGFIGVCWTNTLPNMPEWGATGARLGNNPIVFAVPRPPAHVVLDMAMSQFSYGALAAYRERGEMLPVDGGFDSAGRLTRDPAAIEASQRPLPIGYWKGSGLAIVLDMIAAMLSGGRATHQIPMEPERERAFRNSSSPSTRRDSGRTAPRPGWPMPSSLRSNPAIRASARCNFAPRISLSVCPSIRRSGGKCRRWTGRRTRLQNS